MLASILIGLDPEFHNDERVQSVVRWAKPTGATLVGMGIIDEPGIRAIEPAWPVGGTPGKDPVMYRGYDRRLAEVDGEVDDVLRRFAACCGQAGVSHLEVKASGSPHELIEREAQTCDLIILPRGARFRFRTRDNEADETIKRVLKNAPRPLLITPDGELSPGPVIIAYDGSLQAARALAAFQATGIGGSGQVHVLTIDSNILDATRHADRAVKYLEHHKLAAVPHILPSSPHPAHAILDHARRLGAGMLVMGAYSQPVLREFFVGSVTRTMLQACPVPVFCYH
jgi:nucleotide-binding universal stress UspA family protein